MSESMQGISIELIGYPSENDWEEVKRRALITCWKDAKTPPGSDWKSRILNTTRKCMEVMCALVVGVTPEYAGKLVPLCEYCNGVCHEMKPCGRYPYA